MATERWVPGARIRKRLGARLAIAVVASLLLILGPAGAISVAVMARSYRDEARDRAGAMLASLSAPSALTLAEYSLNRLDSYLAEAARPSSQDVRLLSVAMIDVAGRTVAASTDALEVPQAPGHPAAVVEAFAQRAMASRQPLWQRLAVTDGHAILLASMPAVSGQRWGTLIGIFDLHLVEARIADATRILVGALLVLALLLGVVAYVAFSRLAVKPLEALAAAAQAIQGGQRRVRLGWDRKDELGLVARSFDLMADEIESYTGSLEAKVAERSAEVEAKNRDLEALNARLQAANAELDRLAHIDALTAVANRRSFDQAFAALDTSSDRPWALLMCDIDHFKRINDTLGHPIGDAVLREVSQILRDSVRGDDQLARYGGEEFVAVLRDTGRDGALDVAERVRAQVASTDFAARLGVPLWPITISIGVAVAPEDGKDREQLMQRADQAMYVAKTQGRNRVVAWDSSHDAGHDDPTV